MHLLIEYRRADPSDRGDRPGGRSTAPPGRSSTPTASSSRRSGTPRPPPRLGSTPPSPASPGSPAPDLATTRSAPPHFHRRTPLRDASLSTHHNRGPAQDRLAPNPLVRLGQRVVDLAVLGTADDRTVASVLDRHHHLVGVPLAVHHVDQPRHRLLPGRLVQHGARRINAVDPLIALFLLGAWLAPLGPRPILLVQDPDHRSRGGRGQGGVQVHAPGQPAGVNRAQFGMVCKPVKFSVVVSWTTRRVSWSRHRWAVAVATP